MHTKISDTQYPQVVSNQACISQGRMSHGVVTMVQRCSVAKGKEKNILKGWVDIVTNSFLMLHQEVQSTIILEIAKPENDYHILNHIVDIPQMCVE